MHTQTLRGASGELRLGDQVAATLSTWSLNRLDGDCWTATASVAQRDAALLTPEHADDRFDLVLRFGQALWRFDNVDVEDLGARLAFRGDGRPQVKGVEDAARHDGGLRNVPSSRVQPPRGQGDGLLRAVPASADRGEGATQIRAGEDRVSDRRIQHSRIVHLDLAPPYEGWWLEVDADFTLGQLEDLQSKDLKRIQQTLAEIVTGWNFANKAGAPLPIGQDGVRQISVSLLFATVQALGNAVVLPNELSRSFSSG